jgi:hypothetical protein
MSSYERFRDPDDSQPGFWCGPNDGGIERGDSADTGDEEAGPTDGALDDLTVLDADDPSLGLTDIGDVPPEDWAADTGPTHSAEEKNRIAWDQLKSKPSHKPSHKR